MSVTNFTSIYIRAFMRKVFCEESSTWGGGRRDDQMVKSRPYLNQRSFVHCALLFKQASDPQSQHTSAGQCGSLHSSHLSLADKIYHFLTSPAAE